jgi:TorA maturation chaperone TorD
MTLEMQPGSSALDEETARAELYGVLAALYYAAPTPELLAQLRVAATEAPAAGGFLEEPWRLLVGAAREHDDAALAREYDALFGGVGKPAASSKRSRWPLCAATSTPWAWCAMRQCPKPRTTSPACAR